MGWELTKSGCHVRSPELTKMQFICIFQTYYPYYCGFLMDFFWLLHQFSWQPPFPVAHFGWWTLISQDIAAGLPKVAAKISNWVGTRSHRSHLSGDLV